MSKRQVKRDFLPPPHENADTHKLVMAHVDTMTREQFIQSLVDAGICTSDGKLTEHYRPTPKRKNGRKAA